MKGIFVWWMHLPIRTHAPTWVRHYLPIDEHEYMMKGCITDETTHPTSWVRPERRQNIFREVKGCRDGQMERSLLLHHLPSSHPLNHMLGRGDDDMCENLTEWQSDVRNEHLIGMKDIQWSVENWLNAVKDPKGFSPLNDEFSHILIFHLLYRSEWEIVWQLEGGT